MRENTHETHRDKANGVGVNVAVDVTAAGSVVFAHSAGAAGLPRPPLEPAWAPCNTDT